MAPVMTGCDQNGLDDGTTVRTLTAKAVAPFIAGPNMVLGLTDEGLKSILRPAPGD
jgi:altronate dehydratase